MQLHPDEIRSWLRAFSTDPVYAFHAVPNHVYSDLRRYGYIDPENDLTDTGRDWLDKYDAYQQMVVHCEPRLGIA